MKTAKNERAKSKANAKKQVKLKPTTRAMLHRAKFMRALYPHGRAFYARHYREGRRLGMSNLDILNLRKPSAEEKRKKIEAERAEYEAIMAEQLATSEPSVDSAPCEDSPALQSQDSSVDKDTSVSTPPSTPRRRKPRVLPQHRQAEFSFGSD